MLDNTANNPRYSMRRVFVDVGIFSLGVNILMLVMPLYMLQVYDRVLSSASIDTLIFLSLIAGFALIILGILEGVRAIYATRIANRFELNYGRPAMLRAMAENDNRAGGARIAQALSQVRSFLNSRLAFLVFDLPFVPLFIGLLYFIHPVLFWMTLGGAVLLVLIALLNQWATSRAGNAAIRADAGGQITAQALLANAETLRAMGMTQNALDRWQIQQLTGLESSDARSRVSSFMTGLSRTIRFSLQIAILGVGAWLVLDRQMTAGMIFAASIISGKGLQPIDQVIGSWRQILEGLAAWRTITRAVKVSSEPQVFTEFDAPSGQINAQNIYFHSRADQGRIAILKGLSFGVPAGKTLAILGKSGAGKSTLLRILAGAIRPSNGEVRIDNNDIKNWNPESLGRHIGYVEQRVDLLPGTIAENIARFDAHARDEEIIAAAKAANVDRTIEAMPDAYQTRVGATGRSLSGGEMQQIGLARAFYGNPKILLLDEPNASLDPEARKKFGQAIAGARQLGKTIIMITQRDELLEYSDLVLAIRDGSRVDFGARDEVLTRLFGTPQDRPPVAATSAAASPFKIVQTAPYGYGSARKEGDSK